MSQFSPAKVIQRNREMSRRNKTKDKKKKKKPTKHKTHRTQGTEMLPRWPLKMKGDVHIG